MLLAGAVLAHAQEPLPGQAPPVQPQGNPPPAQNGMVNVIQFPNADVTAVLRFYETLTGKTVLWDNAVQGTMTVMVNQRVSTEEAIKILETSFLLNGYSLVPGEGNIVKVVSGAKNPKTAGVAVYSEASDLPATSQVVSFLFRLQYADAQEMATTIQAILGNALTNYSSVVPLPRAQAVLVTESTDVIRSLFKVIAENDVPTATVVSEFLTLQRADATDVLGKLEKIFEKPAQGAPGGGAVPGRAGAGIPAAGGSISEGSIIVGAIKLTADVRTNRIHVITRPINMPFIRNLVAEFDADSLFGEPSLRPLKYVSARDVLGVIVKAITEPGVKAEDVPTSGNQQARTQQNTPVVSNNTGVNGSSGEDSSQTFTEELQTQPKDISPQAVTVGGTKIIADNRANAIIVLGSAEVKGKIFRVLDQLDVRASQVMLNTVIGELTLGENEEVGIDFLLRNGGFLSSGTSGISTSTSLPNATVAVSNNTSAPLLDPSTLLSAQSLAAAGSGFTAYIAATKSLETIVKALQGTQRFHVISRPMVFTSNNERALIASGQEIAVPVNSLSGLTNNTTAAVQTSIEYKRVALQLEVVPLINADREVSLDIVQKIDSLNGSTTVDGNSIPTIQTRELKTHVSVPDRATVVLGGLITKSVTLSDNGIPYLSKIPVLGWLFRDRTTGKTRTELIILMQPRVMDSPVALASVKRREERRLYLEPNVESSLDPLPSRGPEFHARMSPRNEDE